MKIIRFAVALAAVSFVAAGPLPSIAQDKAAKGQNVSKGDAEALSRLAQADMAEVEAGKVAAQKAENAEVKKFGEHMVEDHSKMLEEGRKIAEAKGIKPPAGPDKKHQNALKKLEGLSGAEFDRRFMSQMVEDHQDALKLAQRTAKNAKDPEIRAHAEKGAPRIQEHLDQAKKIQASLKGGADKGGKASRKQ